MEDDAGRPAVDRLTLAVRPGEIVGIAGVSGNGQRELVEALIGQRPPVAGEIRVDGQPYRARARRDPRSRARSACPRSRCATPASPGMSVAENMALRNFDQAPLASGPWLRRRAMRAQAERWIAAFKVKTPGPDAPIATLSGGNVQRAVLARELSEPASVLIAANPGLRPGLRGRRRDPRPHPRRARTPARRCCWSARTSTSCWRCRIASS